MRIQTVIFDLDGVILDTEQVWHAVRRDFAARHGGRWTEEDQRAAMGANSEQWAAYMREKCGVRLSTAEIYAGVVEELKAWYARELPLLPGARKAVISLAEVFQLGVASSSPLELIEYALALADLRSYFTAVVSSDEVEHGKPAPDVYLLACQRLHAAPDSAAAVEDSASGIKAAAAAGLAVVAIPNLVFTPSEEALAMADVVLGSVAELTPAVIDRLAERRGLGSRGGAEKSRE